MDNIRQITAVLEAYTAHTPTDIYTGERLTEAIKEAHRSNHTGLPEDEEILFAFGHGIRLADAVKRVYNSFSDIRNCMKEVRMLNHYRINPLCITDKALYGFGRSYLLSDIRTIALGKDNYHRGQYSGTDLLINGKKVGSLELNDPRGTAKTILNERIVLSYLFSAMSGTSTPEELNRELLHWKNAPAENVTTPYQNGWAFILVSFLTAGLAYLFHMYRVSLDLNKIVSQDNEGPIENYPIAFLKGVLTIGVYWLVWRMRLLKRIEKELHRRGLPNANTFNAQSTWCWSVFGIVIGIGPIIYLERLYNAMDALTCDYNLNG